MRRKLPVEKNTEEAYLEFIQIYLGQLMIRCGKEGVGIFFSKYLGFYQLHS